MRSRSMTELGKLNTTDKVEHGYTDVYDSLFYPIRYNDIRILEIGFWRGRGARTLAEYFPRAVVHGADNEPKWDLYEKFPKVLRKRIKLWEVDQGDPDSLNAMLHKIAQSPPNKDKRGIKPFDIIIDDGSHRPEHQRTSFETLWSQVVLGGYYIIEDFHPAYRNGQHATVSWLFDTVHELNRYGDKYGEVTTDIQSIMFAFNQVIIRKVL